MILAKDHSDKYLSDYRKGEIKKGLAIGCDDLDNHLRYVQGQLNMINGHDNVGKTVWMIWYYLCLSVKHGLKWDIYSAENKPEMLERILIEFYNTKKLTEIKEDKYYSSRAFIREHFNFIDFKGFYKYEELFDAFGSTNSDGALIDPYSGLNQNFGYEDNLRFLNESRNFVNNTNKTLYVNTHINTEASRLVWGNDAKDSSLVGYSKAPNKSHSEGGTRFSSRSDDFITIHRYLGHPIYHFNTMIYTRKIRDTEKGGKVMPINSPVYFDWNHGCGFTCEGQNPLNPEDTNYSQAPF